MATHGDRMARLQAEMGRPPFNRWLAPEPLCAEEGRIELRLRARPEHCHQADPPLVHSGVIAALIDIAGHAVVAVEQARPAPTIALAIDYLRPAPGPDLTATALLRRLGRGMSRADVEIRAGARLVALGRGTFANPGDAEREGAR
jgi:uncharacterized protein (TIGR00369 family)